MRNFRELIAMVSIGDGVIGLGALPRGSGNGLARHRGAIALLGNLVVPEAH